VIQQQPPEDRAEHDAEASLWRRVERPAPGECPDLDLLAAFIDGRLTDVEREAVESHVAACAVCVDAVRDGAVIAAEPGLTMVSPGVIERAAALVAAPASKGRFALALRWSLAAAASIAVSAAGYVAGQRSSAAANDSDLAGEASFGMLGSWSGGAEDGLIASLIALEDEETLP
jgi:hypothetical protein